MSLERALNRTLLGTIHLKKKFDPTNKVTYLQFESLSNQNFLHHGIFTRHGGISNPPYDSLNIGYNTGDRERNVSKNLELIREVIGAEELIFLNQVHGQDILILHREDSPELMSSISGDGIITDIPRIGLMIKQADCQAVILFDPVKNVVSNVHCGWRGNTYNILGTVVSRMHRDFGCKEIDLMAGIGPSLGPCCAEFISYKEIFPETFERFMVRENYFDLWAISRNQLLEAGLKDENIEIAGICSKCNTDLFYSYRADGTTGRFATVAMLN